MIFDSLCTIVENHEELEYLIPILRNTKLFKFNYRPHEVLPKTIPNRGFIFDNFSLPFRSTAVEDRASVNILIDREEGNLGISQERFTICATINSTPPDEFENNEGHEEFLEICKIYPELKNSMTITTGTIKSVVPTSNQTFEIDYRPHGYWIASKREMFYSAETGKQIDMKFLRNSGMNSMVAIQEIIYFNQPNLFILEEKPLKPKIHGRIHRSENRSTFIMLEPNKIRKRLNLEQPKGTHNSPIPHERRRHGRWYRDARYAKGREIKYCHRGLPYYMYRDIPATWIGSTEKKVGNKLYKVRIDI